MTKKRNQCYILGYKTIEQDQATRVFVPVDVQRNPDPRAKDDRITWIAERPKRRTELRGGWKGW